MSTQPPYYIPNINRDASLDTYLADRSSLHTDYSGYTSDTDGSSFYSGGGKRDPKLKCQFICESPLMTNQGQPQIIELDLSPTGVSWDYDLRYQIYNTFGGQVVQILGVDIKNVQITGRFGFESWFGKQFSGSAWTSLYQDANGIGVDQQYVWKNDPSVKNGLMQMAHWFRAYFSSITQPYYDQYPMYFSFPHRGWWWPIRPRVFPNIKFSQEDFAPTWTVEADYLQYLQDQKIQGDILQVVKDDIGRLTDGVGNFTDFLNFAGTANFDNLSSQSNTISQRYSSHFTSSPGGAAAFVNSSAPMDLAHMYQSGLSIPWNSNLLSDLGIKGL